MEIKKVNNLFICHRPYHVVVSAHIINHNIQNSNKTVKNTCVLLDVPVFNKNTSPGGQISFDELTNSSSLNKIDYIHFDHLYRLEKIFDKVLKINRSEEVRIWNIFKFKEYYKSLIRNIKKIFSNSELNSINNIYIFSDKEKPVEIIASILKEKYSSKVFLVDEGIVSYYKNKSYFKSLIKRFIVKAFRLKYISNSMAYGHSGINDYFLTFDKKDVINQKNIINVDCGGFMRNFVVIDNRVIEVDVGSYKRSQKQDTVDASCRHLQKWSTKKAPKLESYIEQKIKQRLKKNQRK